MKYIARMYMHMLRRVSDDKHVFLTVPRLTPDEPVPQGFSAIVVHSKPGAQCEHDVAPPVA